MALMSSSLTTDQACDSSENWAFAASLFLLGIPLLRGICCWGDRASNVFTPCASPFSSGFAWFDMIVSVGKGITPFTSFRMPAIDKNDS
jgi:hypothetical protein